MASPFLTFVPTVVPSKWAMLSQEIFSILNCLLIFSLVSGRKEETNTEIILILSDRLYKTVPNLSFELSSLASTQGVVSSIYLLALPISSQMYPKASGI